MIGDPHNNYIAISTIGSPGAGHNTATSVHYRVAGDDNVNKTLI